MDRVSKLIMAYKSPEYLEHLDNLSRTTLNTENNMQYSNGKVYLEITMKGKRKAIVFPKYGNIIEILNQLHSERDPLFIRYRFLRNKIVYEQKVSSNCNSEYDATVKRLSEIDDEIEVLETYKRIVNNDIIKERKNAIESRMNILNEMTKSNSTLKQLSFIKGLHDIDTNIKNTKEDTVDFYIEKMPKIMTIEKEDNEEKEKDEKKKKKIEKKKTSPKKRGRKPKEVKVGGRIYAIDYDENKLKDIIKQRLRETKQFKD